MVEKTESDRVVFKLNGLWISYAHTFFAGCAFIAALVVGCLLHYEKIVQNEHFGYPQEWFPSVSATIGDRYPERSVYQLFIAVTSGPRFLLCGLTYILTAKEGDILSKVLLVCGLLRTFTCGGWTYVTSTDDHDWHDIFMISYIVLTLPWTALRTIRTPKNTKARKYRFLIASTFFGSLIPLIYFFIQHKVKVIPGAYTIYAFFEWLLVGLDVAFDAVTAYDFPSLEITIIDQNKATSQVTDVPMLRDPTQLRRGPPVLGFIVSVVNWFVWWSVVTSIGAMIWYFPLWFMGISGYEAFILSLVAPLLLVIPPLRKLLVKFPQIAFAGQVIGVASYWVAAPTSRMTWVGVGAMFASLAGATTFYSASLSTRPGIVTSQTVSFVVGLLLTVVARIPAFTNNPIWPIMKPSIGGINHWGVALGLAGAFCAGTMVPDVQPAGKASLASKSSSKKEKSTPPAKIPPFAIASGLGAWFFYVTTFLSDISNIPLWVWTGYPLRGPSPVPDGLIVLFAAAAGFYWGLRSKFPISTIGIILFNVFAVILTTFNDWPGFIGGVGVAVYVSAFTPALFDAAAHVSPAIAFGVGLSILSALYFAETWTVAYAFVPGGWLLRERMWVVLTFTQLLLTTGIYAAARPFKIGTAVQRVVKLASYGLLFTLVLGSVFTVNRLQSHAVPEPVHPESASLTAGIWTIHFGLDNGLWASETRMRDLIADAEVDVIGLLESDTQRTIGGHRDITQRIASDLGFYVDYGPPSGAHTWGAALLSRFPIVKSEHHLTPSPVGELAPAIHATLDVYNELVDVIVFHSGQEEDPEDRRLQTEYVTDILGSTGDRGTILLSYLVTKPLEGNYNTWVSEKSGMHDIDPSDDDRWCEYILYKNLHRTGYARLSRDTITDTELQIGRFQVFEPDYSNTRISENEVQPDLRFPSVFRGNGIRGHRYHVFDEPRYFQ